MNDKQKLALKELADVMEKHGIAMSSEGSYPVFVWGRGFEEIILECSDHNLTTEYIREALKE